MATSVVMPQMGYDMQEGTLVRWLKQEGEAIARGEAIAEIETDKAVIEMEAYASGVVLKTVVDEGSTVPVGDTIAFIGTPGEPVPDVTPSAAATAEAAPEPEQAAEPAAPAAAPASGPVRASPVARRLAQEKGIDLAQVTGTGPNGRITKEDVEAHESAAAAAPASAAEAPAAVEPAARRQQGELVPLTRMRQAIARRTAQSKREVPHFYVSAGVDMTAAMALRSQINEALAGEARVSVNDLIVKACALTLAKYPAFNASFEGNNLRMNPAINVSIAVAVEYGLLVVSLGDCRGRSLVDISKAARGAVERAQSGVLREDDYTGGTFSISNMGMFDVDSFSAIIYPPQSAVIAVGTVRQQPVVRDGEIKIAQMMQATLSTDHRVADGAQAAEFLVEVKRVLENPVTLVV
ncbi:MAG: dihydrolipoamide acetyltransferase family protein [Chloroflexota bacterium]|nr:dihydrolipoamide acetyltransferase family protein [Chloroflexota bacterium]MDE2941215.1 dihydrolipoamide acetyltransferase family protein [Chloroflexota bacterium]MDE3267202.1 dihydrolipoamide acetyltransferase family protein [Chloroflexota bacterium]